MAKDQKQELLEVDASKDDPKTKKSDAKGKEAQGNKDTNQTEEIKSVVPDEVLTPEDAAAAAADITKISEERDSKPDSESNSSSSGTGKSQALSKPDQQQQQETLAPLTDEDRKLFAQLDKKVQKSLVEAAFAFKEIKEMQLYREEFASFESYCEDRIGRSRRYVEYLVQFAIIREKLVEHNVPDRLLPTSEAQVRPLKKFKDPAKRAEIWLQGCQDANNTVPSREQMAVTISQLENKTATGSRASLEVGDCVRLAKRYKSSKKNKDEDESKALVGYWGFVDKVYKNGNLNVRFPQKTLKNIPREALTKIKDQVIEDSDDPERDVVFAKLQEIYGLDVDREDLVEENLRFFGKKQDVNFTFMEDNLLDWMIDYLRTVEAHM